MRPLVPAPADRRPPEPDDEEDDDSWALDG
jgi:hypothetical protein